MIDRFFWNIDASVNLLISLLELSIFSTL